MEEKKIPISVVTIGGPDVGKSTLVGKMMVELGKVSEKEMEELRKVSSQMERENYLYAFVCDKLRAERERGITIDLTFHFFETQNYAVSISDTPGRRDFVKNTINGIFQANIAILVLDPLTNNSKVHQEQLEELCAIIKISGVRHLIAPINKMDHESINYSQEKYQNYVKYYSDFFFSEIGFEKSFVTFLPISAYQGLNLTKLDQEKMGWYHENNLLGLIDSIGNPENENENNMPLRIPLQDVYKIGGIGTVPVGKVAYGKLHKGQSITIAPPLITVNVPNLESNHVPLEVAESGLNIGFNVQNISVREIRRGYVACHSTRDPPKRVNYFFAKVVILNHPGRICVGYTPVLDVHCAHIACRFAQLISKIDKVTDEVIEESPTFILAGDCAMIKLLPTKPLHIESNDKYPKLSRFTIRDMRKTVACGYATKIFYENRGNMNWK
ncbi:translation factor [Anaeramoeba flamelloides]|uniref:Translation factor n=1 Tax=Anaeramoeba flamelloides TaxID=1746091 RepID=A0ABQ8Z6I2_9EUKA|nr:translation factor [Anaeramoeba flamelloides]